MDLKRKVAMAGVTLAVAFAAGQYVQHGLTLPFRAAASSDPQPTDITLLSAGPETLPALPDAPEMPPLPALGRLPLAAKESRLSLTLPVEPETPAPQSTSACPTRLDLSAAPSAVLKLALHAPCHRNERIVLRHAGLAVTARTTADGQYTGSLPAMDEQGAVSILFGDGETADAALAFPDIGSVRRFAVQWLADDAFQIHTDENASQAGTLTRLGDADVLLPMRAEIYTYAIHAKGGADVTLEAAVTPTTCGRELLGETVESRGGRSIVTDLNVTMPGCDAVGDYLLLKNLSGDVNIAAAD